MAVKKRSKPRPKRSAAAPSKKKSVVRPRKVVARHFEVCDMRVLPRFASDHLPLAAALCLKK